MIITIKQLILPLLMEYELVCLAVKIAAAFAHHQYTGKSIFDLFPNLIQNRLVRERHCMGLLVLCLSPPRLCCHHVYHSTASVCLALTLAIHQVPRPLRQVLRCHQRSVAAPRTGCFPPVSSLSLCLEHAFLVSFQ